ncbi:MAG: alpha/beta fold hydrolase [Firmicutes bacterium]|jgi:carboxylesterase|nr:alpha/beta fold hydrolase [Bacillota bacterium]
MQPEVMRGAETFTIPAGDGRVAALIIHGFAGSPSEVRPIGEHLASRGIFAYAPRLPGHGTSVEDMSRTRFTDWVGCAESALVRMKSEHDLVFVVGFSMGGLIALYLAQRHEVDGIAVISSPMRIRDPRVVLLPILKFFQKYDPPAPVPPEVSSGVNKVAYTQKPLVCAESLIRLMSIVRRNLAKVTTPALVVAGAQDRTAPPEDARYIADHLASVDKRLVLLPNSRHMCMFGEDQERLFEELSSFVTARSSTHRCCT